MALKDKLTNDFLEGIQEITLSFEKINYKKTAILKKGFAYYIQFKKKDDLIEFQFGPPDFQIEIIISSEAINYSFKDLLAIPDIEIWVNENLYSQKNERDIKSELNWYLKLIKFSIKILK